MSDTNIGNQPPPSGALQGLVNVLFNAVQVLSRLQQTLSKVFPQWTGTTATTATGGAATLPANPAGFIVVVNPISGATVKIAYYNQ